MKNFILKILLPDTCNCKDCKEESAVKIESHVMKYSKWVADSISVDWDTGQYNYYPVHGGEVWFMKYEELYPFWVADIKK